MTEFKELFKSANWKEEKHVPVIEAPDKVKKGEFFDVKVTIGKEVAEENSPITSEQQNSPPMGSLPKGRIPAQSTPITKLYLVLKQTNPVLSSLPVTVISTDYGRTKKRLKRNK